MVSEQDLKIKAQDQPRVNPGWNHERRWTRTVAMGQADIFHDFSDCMPENKDYALLQLKVLLLLGSKVTISFHISSGSDSDYKKKVANRTLVDT